MASYDGIGIVKFLKGKTLLITGATGFLGKVLVEKILQSVPDSGKIYLMVKASNMEAAMGKLKIEIMDAEIFKCLKEKYGKSYQNFMLNKLVPVVGNMCEPNLGLEESIADVIARQVDIIINVAAKTRFDERYDVSIKTNTRGPFHLMHLARKCNQLKLFLHVSTVYASIQREGRIMEKPFYVGDGIRRVNFNSESQSESLPAALDVVGEIELALYFEKIFSDNSVSENMKKLGQQRAKAHGWHDTYVFTKAMGEMIIDHMRGKIPVVIIRPAIIESTYREPFSGWIQGNRMIDPLIQYYGKGELAGFPIHPDCFIDIVPADMVVNVILAAIAKHGVTNKPDINLYQIASSAVNPLIMQDLATIFFEYFKSSPCIDSKGRPINIPTTLKLYPSMEEFFTHVRRDVAMVSSNSKPQLERISHFATVYEPYSFSIRRYDCSNTYKLWGSMSEEEKTTFGFDIASIDWKDYIINIHIPGLRKYVMKERGSQRSSKL